MVLIPVIFENILIIIYHVCVADALAHVTHALVILCSGTKEEDFA